MKGDRAATPPGGYWCGALSGRLRSVTTWPFSTGRRLPGSLSMRTVLCLAVEAVGVIAGLLAAGFHNGLATFLGGGVGVAFLDAFLGFVARVTPATAPAAVATSLPLPPPNWWPITPPPTTAPMALPAIWCWSLTGFCRCTVTCSQRWLGSCQVLGGGFHLDHFGVGPFVVDCPDSRRNRHRRRPRCLPRPVPRLLLFS